jgi:hypothetical protein
MPPSLTTLSLFLPTWPFDNAPTIRIPDTLLSNLTTFHLQCRNWPRSFLIATLRNCPNLETLTLDMAEGLWKCDGTPISRNLGRASIQFRNLETLRLLRVHPDGAIILSSLKAPSISHLEISFVRFRSYRERDWESDSEDQNFRYPYVDQTFSRAFWEFLQDGSQNTLQYLRIHAYLIHCAVFDNIWRIESLQHLCLCLDDAVYNYNRTSGGQSLDQFPTSRSSN